MCGRFVQIDSTIARLKSILDFHPSLDTYAPHRHQIESYNIAPDSKVTVIRARDGNLALTEMLWGIKPQWFRDSSRSLINARAETLLKKPTFRKLLKQKIIIPAEGFYEWQTQQGQQKRRAKIPYYFYRADDNPLLLAGLYEKSANPETGEVVDTFVILTTNPNEMMAPYHDRMPVILEPSRAANWIMAETTENLINEIAVPPSNHLLATRQVSTRVNFSGVDGPELIAGIENE
ncbi:MAG: SOS response-associated peptidase [Actinomycetota bacterium]|nr:MAG: SOS response-associated peptidase [Actinomycetota bacterium]